MAERTGIMLAQWYTEKRWNALPKPAFLQPKINGDRCRAVFDTKGKVSLFSSSGALRISVPHINKELEAWNLKGIHLDGELYTHGMPHEEIRSRVSRTQCLHDDHKAINYYIFDEVNEKLPQAVRLNNLEQLKPLAEGSESIFLVPSFPIQDFDMLNLAYDKCLEEGYEGIILRHPTAPYIKKKVSTMLKLKPVEEGTYLIIGYEEERDFHTKEPKGALGALILMDKNENAFNCGSGFTRLPGKKNNRTELWQIKDDLIGKLCDIKYQAISERGVPLMPRIKEVRI